MTNPSEFSLTNCNPICYSYLLATRFLSLTEMSQLNLGEPNPRTHNSAWIAQLIESLRRIEPVNLDKEYEYD
jgi:hypothetical protein